MYRLVLWQMGRRCAAVESKHSPWGGGQMCGRAFAVRGALAGCFTISVVCVVVCLRIRPTSPPSVYATLPAAAAAAAAVLRRLVYFN